MKKKNKMVDFSVCYQALLDASSLGNLLTNKGVKRSKIAGQGVIREDEGTIRAGQDF